MFLTRFSFIKEKSQTSSNQDFGVFNAQNDFDAKSQSSSNQDLGVFNAQNDFDAKSQTSSNQDFGVFDAIFFHQRKISNIIKSRL